MNFFYFISFFLILFLNFERLHYENFSTLGSFSCKFSLDVSESGAIVAKSGKCDSILLPLHLRDAN